MKVVIDFGGNPPSEVESDLRVILARHGPAVTEALLRAINISLDPSAAELNGVNLYQQKVTLADGSSWWAIFEWSYAGFGERLMVRRVFDAALLVDAVT